MLLLMAAASRAADKKQKQRPSAFVTLIGTAIALLVYAIWNGGHHDFLTMARLVFTLDLQTARSTDSLMRMAPFIAAAIVAALVLTMLTMPLLAMRIKRLLPDYEAPQLFVAKEPRRQFAIIMAWLFGEELFARWLFLGLLTKVPGMGGVLGFIVLFLVGNALFAVAHYLNYKGDKKILRHPIMVLPQFAGGVVMTIAYIPFGLLGAVLTHVAYDMILFTLDRRDRFNGGEIMLCLYHLLVGSVAFWFFAQSGHDLRDMKLWLEDGTTSMALPGWSFGNYVAAVLVVTSAMTLLMEVLLYDREGGENGREATKSLVHFGVGLILASSVLVTVHNVWHEAMAIKVLIFAIGITGLVKSRSGSGVARCFWEACLIISIMLATTLAVGPANAGLLVAIIMVVHIPDRIIRYYDTDDLPRTVAFVRMVQTGSKRP